MRHILPENIPVLSGRLVIILSLFDSKFSWEQLHESVVKPSRRRQEGILEAKKEANAYKDLVAAANTANSGKRSKKRRPSFARTFDAQASPQHSPETSDDVLNFTTIG